MHSVQEVESMLAIRHAESAAAEKALAQARKEKSGSARLQLSLGKAAYAIREYGAAMAAFKISHTLDESAESAARLALCAWRLGDLAAAQSWIQEALAHDPKGSVESIVAGRQTSYLGILSTILLSKGEIESVEKTSAAALAADADDVAALWTMATVRMTQGDAREATHLLSRASEKAGGDLLPSRLGQQFTASRGLLNAGIALRPHSVEIADISRLVV